MRKFREVLQDCGLIDLSFKGPQFTYSNRHKGADETKARVDRALANQNWRLMFPEAEVWHKVAPNSDHAPLIINWRRRGRPSRLNLFSFEPMWLKHKEFGELVNNIWGGRKARSYRISETLKNCVDGLDAWSKRKFGRVKDTVARLKRDLGRVRELERTDEVMNQEARLSSELDEWLLREELYWKQRSRVNLMKEGDRNTRFFSS
ncbi:hypothetical protein QQ045_015634 [Rhodiola kirilowii]